MPAPVSAEDLLDLIRKSNLLDVARLDAYVREQREANSLPTEPVQLAKALVRDGLLTHFQAQQFLLGKWRAFIISGKYKVLEHLGSGGMGSVYLCEHLVMHRQVAIKVLPPRQAHDPASLERFHREARAVAALDHPNIVRAHDIDHDGKLHFLVMEFVDGASLHDIVKHNGAMDIARAAHYISQSADGLQHAHEAGLVHRDIKPGNLLLSRDGTLKILDLGLARFFHDDSDNITKKHDESVLGTVDYLAPEQTIDSAVDIRADIYSLGITFYYLLTGKNPFSDGTTAQKMIWQQVRQPRPIRSTRPEVPEELVAVVTKMIAKAAGDRYQTPGEIVEALAPWTAEAIPPPPESEMPQLCPAVRRVALDGPASPNVTRRTTPTPRINLPRSPVPTISTPRPTPAAESPLPLGTPDPAGPTKIASDRKKIAVAQAAPDDDAIEILPRTSETAEMAAHPLQETVRTDRLRKLKEKKAPSSMPVELVRRYPVLVAAGAGSGLALLCGVLWWAFSGAGSPTKGTPSESSTTPPIAAAKPGVLPDTAPSTANHASPAVPEEKIGEVRSFQAKIPVDRVAVSPDGKLALLGCNEGGVPLWDLSTGKEVRRLRGHKERVYGVAFSRDGRQAITAGFDQTARVWDVASGKELCRFEGQDTQVWAVAFFPDGRRAVSAEMGNVAHVWETSIGQQLHRLVGHTSPIHAVAVSPDGRYVFTASWDHTVRVWDSETGSERRRFIGHTAEVYSVACSPDGRFALTGSKDNTARLWDVATGAEIRKLSGHTGAVTCVDFSPGGLYAVTASWDKTVRLWEVATAKLLHTYEGHTDNVIGVAYGGDRRHVLSGGEDKTARVWALPAALAQEPIPSAGSAATISAPPEPPLTILLPMTRQVIQRDDKNQARLVVAGRFGGQVDRVEARLTPLPARAGQEAEWVTIAEGANLKDGRFQGAIDSVPAGSYTLDVRALVIQKVTAKARVERVGVGEVLISAGQSNAANYGSGRLTSNDERVSAWNGHGWQPANDPQPIATGDGGTPWPALGDLLAVRLNVPIGLVTLGVGATEVAQWQPDSKHYQLRLKKELQRFGKNGVRCVLWHQGESDTFAGTSAEDYARLLNQVIKQSRVDAGYEVKWLVAGVAYVGDEHKAKEAAVREGQRKVCDGKLTLAGPVTDDLRGDDRAVDKVHFSEKGLREHGRLWYEVLMKSIYTNK